jgi:hypothetical protein
MFGLWAGALFNESAASSDDLLLAAAAGWQSLLTQYSNMATHTLAMEARSVVKFS